jgi:PET assembly of cytochrome c oxidase, mitochondrial
MLPQKKGPIIVMISVVSITIGSVLYSHYAQIRDHSVMKAGVERDKERLRILWKQQKIEKQQQLQQQQQQQEQERR